MTGPGPKQEGAALVVEPNEDYSLILEALESQAASVHYTERMLGITAKQAFERVRSRLSEQAALIDRLTRERDALETTIKRASGQLDAGLIALHAPKSEVKLEPEKDNAPTA